MGNIFSEARERLGISYLDLAEMIGIEQFVPKSKHGQEFKKSLKTSKNIDAVNNSLQSTISHWFTKYRGIPIKYLAKLADCLQIDRETAIKEWKELEYQRFKQKIDRDYEARLERLQQRLDAKVKMMMQEQEPL
jgi:transcriptional regulator with XRE-family HTH domain